MFWGETKLPACLHNALSLTSIILLNYHLTFLYLLSSSSSRMVLQEKYLSQLGTVFKIRTPPPTAGMHWDSRVRIYLEEVCLQFN